MGVQAMAKIEGNPSGNILFGTTDSDEIHGYAGNDRLYGLTGNDKLFGGSGNDLLAGDEGNDILDGGSGNDFLYGGDGLDTASYQTRTMGFRIDLAAGQATSLVGGESDLLYSIENAIGTNQADVIFGDALANRLDGKAGNDSIFGDIGVDDIIGGDGDDLLVGGGGRDTIRGGAGNDRLFGGIGNDSLTDTTGVDMFFGGDGVDRVWYSDSPVSVQVMLSTGKGFGGASGDRYDSIEGAVGSEFSDVLQGNALANDLVGRGGDDLIQGFDGNDYLDGGNGNDDLRGGNGNDALYGDDPLAFGITLNRQDKLFGEAGNDTLAGFAGKDTLTGGTGLDTFFYYFYIDSGNGAANRDLITDFNRADDIISLKELDANTLTLNDNAFAFIGTSAFSGVAGQLRYALAGGNTIISADANGDRVADLQIELRGLFTLTAADFIL